MRILFALGLAWATFALAQCTPLKSLQSTARSDENDGPLGDKPPEGTTQVNPMAFNAVNVWRDGQGSEMMGYPQGYDDVIGMTTPDGVFYVEDALYWTDRKFSGISTEGAKVANGAREYSVQNGKKLKLRFSQISEQKMPHADAVKYCQSRGLRLPTARELFDFCTAEVSEPNYGPNFERGKYPLMARCAGRYIWSASINAVHRSYGWMFSGHFGDTFSVIRTDPYSVQCVGGG